MLIPLSIAEAQADAGRGDGIVPFGAGTETVSPKQTSDTALDKYVGEAMERSFAHLDDEKPAKRKSLDTLLTEGRERNEARETEEREFEASKPSRDYLRGRYPQGDLGKTCENILTWLQALQENPHRATDELATCYLLDGSRLDQRTKQGKAADPDEHPRLRLDRILDDAIEGTDRKEREVSAQQLEKLKRFFPGLSTSEILGRIETMDRDLCADPIKAAESLRIMSGVPATQTMHEAARLQTEYVNLTNWVGQVAASGALPRLEELAPNIVQILGRPDFVRSGDPNNDLGRAYSVAQTATDWVSQVIGSGKLPLLPQVYGTVIEVLADPKSFERTGTMGGDLGRAYSIAVQRSNADRVARARQAQSPRSRGTIPSVGARAGSSLDAIIGNAWAAHS